MPRFANTQALKLASVFSDDALLLAWAKVATNGGTAGSDNQRIEDFGRDLLTEIPRLQTELLQGRHVLQPYLPVFIPKHDGSQRRLLIPSVRDRVAQTAATQALTPVFERGFEAPSFGYRAGHSVQSAINAVLALRDGGCTWVLDTDIDGFFDHVQHAVLQDRLARHISDPDLLQLLIKWLTPSLQQVMGHNPPRTLTVGMAQGSPLSPLYANILLDELDEALMAQGFTPVR